MSKKNKQSALEKELGRRIDKYRNPFINAEPLKEYCDKIKKQAQDGFDDFSFINFNELEQYLPSGVHQLTGEAVVMINQMYADPRWVKSDAGDIPDAEAFIGKINDPVTNLPKTRAFWRCKIEETGEEHLGELESLYTIALAACDTDSHNGETDNAIGSYAIISGFINNEMFEMEFIEVPSIKIIRDFILDISDALNANPEKRIKDMPKKEMFVELVSKLTMAKKSNTLIQVSENNDVDGMIKMGYDKQLKLDAAKLAIKSQKSLLQTAKELNIPHKTLHHWKQKYEKFGETAFRRPSRISSEKMSVNSSSGKRYDRRLKMAAVKLVKENHQPISQVANKLGVGYNNLYYWIRQYEKYGENAFPRGGASRPNS